SSLSHNLLLSRARFAKLSPSPAAWERGPGDEGGSLSHVLLNAIDAKGANLRAGARLRQRQADLARGDGREAIQLLVADGGSSIEFFPACFRLRLDAVRLDTLPLGNELLRQDEVESGRRSEINLKWGRWRVLTRHPEGRRVAVNRALSRMAGRGAVSTGVFAARQIVGEHPVQRGTEFAQPRDVRAADETPVVRRHIEQQYAVAPDRLEIDVQQMGERLDLRILFFMPEPAGANGGVALGRPPDRMLNAGVKRRVGFLHAPLRLVRDAVLVADPADIRAGDGDQRLRL